MPHINWIRPYLWSSCGHKVTTARLSLGPPRCTESPLLDTPVAPELDDHKVGGRHVSLLGVAIVVAAQCGDVDRRVLCAATAQDLNCVKVALGVELGKLKETEEKSLKYAENYNYNKVIWLPCPGRSHLTI